MAINSGFSHKKRWFSIAMLVYQRVTSIKVAVPQTKCFSFEKQIGKLFFDDLGDSILGNLQWQYHFKHPRHMLVKLIGKKSSMDPSQTWLSFTYRLEQLWIGECNDAFWFITLYHVH